MPASCDGSSRRPTPISAAMRFQPLPGCCNFAYSALASFRMGMSGRRLSRERGNSGRQNAPLSCCCHRVGASQVRDELARQSDCSPRPQGDRASSGTRLLRARLAWTEGTPGHGGIWVTGRSLGRMSPPEITKRARRTSIQRRVLFTKYPAPEQSSGCAR